MNDILIKNNQFLKNGFEHLHDDIQGEINLSYLEIFEESFLLYHQNFFELINPINLQSYLSNNIKIYGNIIYGYFLINFFNFFFSFLGFQHIFLNHFFVITENENYFSISCRDSKTGNY